MAFVCQEFDPRYIIRIVPWRLDHITKTEPVVIDENVIEARALSKLHTTFFQQCPKAIAWVGKIVARLPCVLGWVMANKQGVARWR